jgi:transposase
MNDLELENSIVVMHSRGWSIRRISAQFGISRGRVRRILHKNEKNRRTQQLPSPQGSKKRYSKLDPYKEYVLDMLQEHADVTNQRIYEMLQEKGYGGKITVLRDYLAGVRGKKSPDPITCVETMPGQRGSHDWSEYHIRYEQSGQEEKTIFFSFILNYSRRQYIEVVEDKTQTTLLNCLVSTFIYFDGVPFEIKSDNQKACVDKWECGKPLFNKTFLEFATHYHFIPQAIHPGKPRENLKIERPFYYLETNFLNGRKFLNKQDLKDQLQGWLLYYNDTRTHRTTGKRPIDLYQQEMPYLQALADVHFDTSRFAYRIVNNESAIQWEGYYYMVPREYIHETCPVRASQSELTIYSPDFIKLKQYPIPAKGTMDKYIGRHKWEGSAPWPLKPKDIRERLCEMGPIMQQYVEDIKKHNPTHYLYHLKQILSLKAEYYPEDILLAVNRALRYKVYEASSIANFLTVNAQKKNEIRLFPKNHRRHEK